METGSKEKDMTSDQTFPTPALDITRLDSGINTHFLSLQHTEAQYLRNAHFTQQLIAGPPWKI